MQPPPSYQAPNSSENEADLEARRPRPQERTPYPKRRQTPPRHQQPQHRVKRTKVLDPAAPEYIHPPRPKNDDDDNHPFLSQQQQQQRHHHKTRPSPHPTLTTHTLSAPTAAFTASLATHRTALTTAHKTSLLTTVAAQKSTLTTLTSSARSGLAALAELAAASGASGADISDTILRFRGAEMGELRAEASLGERMEVFQMRFDALRTQVFMLREERGQVDAEIGALCREMRGEVDDAGGQQGWEGSVQELQRELGEMGAGAVERWEEAETTFTRNKIRRGRRLARIYQEMGESQE